MLSRLAGWLTVRTYIFLPLLATAIWALARRNYYLLAGYAATIPWLALQLVAAADLPRTLSSYYAFPLLAAMFWPLLGVLQGAPRASPGQRKDAVIGFAVMLAVSFTGLSMQHNPNRTSFAATFDLPPGADHQRKVDEALALLARLDPEHMSVDQGVLSLLPDSFTAEQTFLTPPRPDTNTILYFAHGFQAREAIARARDAGLTRHYAVNGTSIRIASGKPLERMPALAGRITPVAPAENPAGRR